MRHEENNLINDDETFFSWRHDTAFKLVKKKVSFSNKNTIHIIENREDIGWHSFNMHMNDYHYAYIRNEFQKEYNTFIRFNPNFHYYIKSKDELVVHICDFNEKLALTKKFGKEIETR